MLNLFIKINYFILLLITSTFLYASYPEVIPVNNNTLYKQIQSDITENNKRIIIENKILPLQFYKYILNENDSIFNVSSRFNLSYDTIATLNHIDNQLFFINNEYILLPNCQGIFLKENIYENPYEISVNDEKLYFYPGKTFSGKERLQFLITPFASPLKSMYITSEFGNRENPFTGYTEFHKGLDLKANIGTKVFSPYKGRIDNIGYSEFYGNYLIVVHTNGYSSHYYHLHSINCKVGDLIKKGDFIAKTGNSGKSTGPHLHFEIHNKDEAINPRILLGDV